MSILDKHPAPWRVSTRNSHLAEDANGVEIPLRECTEVSRLLMAAPELLAALKERTDNFYPRSDKEEELLDKYEALIARIEGGNG